MEFIKTDIEGVMILRPQVFKDERGYFFERYSQREFEKYCGPVTFVQDNESRSTAGVIRGLHFQRPPFSQAKLVSCTSGRVLDVAVDLRRGSATYGRHVAVELSDENHLSIFIPRGFAHGYAVLSKQATFIYKCDNYYTPESEGGISVEDRTLGIDWHTDPTKAILSEKDKRHPILAEFDTPF